VEGFPRDRLGDRARLVRVAPEDDDSGIVVLQRQSPIIISAVETSGADSVSPRVASKTMGRDSCARRGAGRG
jgi:hypothetical protein